MHISMDIVRGLMITLLAIISYLLISSIVTQEEYNVINAVIILISLGAGAGITILNKDISRKDLNVFRLLLFVGLALFVTGNVLIFQKSGSGAYDLNVIQVLTFGLLIASIGLILVLSQIPAIVYQNIKEVLKEKKK